MKPTVPALALALVLAVAHSSPAQIEDLEQTRAAAEAGDPEAQYNLAVLYRYAVTVRGVEFAKRPRRCRNWLRLAAEQGNPDAQLALGRIYEHGEHIPPNHSEAVKWYTLAAEQGNPLAQWRLGLFHYAGYGEVPKHYRKARYWLEHSARQGFAQAQGRLGWMFYTGEAGEKDLAKAYAWMSLGAYGGDQGSFGYKDRVKTQMTAEELTRALQLAARLWQDTKRPDFR